MAMADRVPTRRQYDTLLALGSGSAAVVLRPGVARPLLNHGWVTVRDHPDEASRVYGWVRITPAGLHALARGVERYGLPNIGPPVDRPPQPPWVTCGTCRGTGRVDGEDCQTCEGVGRYHRRRVSRERRAEQRGFDRGRDSALEQAQQALSRIGPRRA